MFSALAKAMNTNGGASPDLKGGKYLTIRPNLAKHISLPVEVTLI